MSHYIEYIPIITTIFSAFFFREIFAHYRRTKTTYLLWWTLGVVAFGLGTLTESINVLFGWSQINTKAWYIVGALLGGFPLAQGSVYLLMNRKFANATTILFVTLIIGAGICVMLSPIVIPDDFTGKLTGKVFEWKWVRLFSIPINIYALIFLVGGAVYSAVRYYAKSDHQARFKGNIFIAFGGLLPGIGGTFTRMGHVNVLYVTELIGLTLIYIGYKIIKTENRKPQSKG
ncbi:MAG: hypothetical protein L3J05_01485 [Robiginitomaculum sp.]|nr:hypothetical protein [Robiginitomaculum sp.]